MSHSERDLLVSLDVERAALGACLLRNDLLDSSGLTGLDFGHPAHKIIFGAMQTIIQAGEADLVSLTDYLDGTGELDKVGGPEAIAALTDGVPRLAGIDHYVKILREYATRRRLQKAAHDLLALSATSAPEEELVAKAETVLASARISRAYALFGGPELVAGEWSNSQERIKESPRGAKWGLPALDRMTRPCLMRGTTWFVGARPSVGKTSFLIGVADHNVRSGKKVLYVACEMGGRSPEGCVRLTWRLAGQTSRVPLVAIRSVTEMSQEENERYLKSLSFYERADNFLLGYHPRPTTAQVRAMVRQAKSKLGGLDLVLLDYFQKVQPNRHRKGMYEERAEVAGELVAMAGSEGTPLVIGSQLHREAEGEDTQNNRPGLGNLKGAGEQEQEATGVVLLHRWGHRSPGKPLGAEIIVAKQQDGPTGVLAAHFDRETATWECGLEEFPSYGGDKG